MIARTGPQSKSFLRLKPSGNNMKPPTRGPVFACLYPGLCDVARKYGYALAIHGTLVNDLDLVAIPWTEDAIGGDQLKDYLMDHVYACDYSDSLRRFGIPEKEVEQHLSQKEYSKLDAAEMKPHGRRAWNLYLDAGLKIDLSVMPRNGPYEKT